MNLIRNRFVATNHSLSLIAGLLVAFAFSTAQAQQAVNCPDGAFAPTANITCQIPESGVFNFTTVNIPTGVTVKFKANSRNTPVTIIASGDVSIGGSIDISGETGGTNKGGRGGPGGYDGGVGGLGVEGYQTPGNGNGPGGGSGGNGGGGGGYAIAGGNSLSLGTIPPSPDSSSAKGGPRDGSPTLLPLLGGSGGGGGLGGVSSAFGNNGGSGGGGGGAILIFTTGTIRFTSNATIIAVGGNGRATSGAATPGGGGSGGAIRLVAQAITGNPLYFQVEGAAGGDNGDPNTRRRGGSGGHGYIRIEASDPTGFAPQRILPNTAAAISIVTIPRSAMPADAPKLTIKSIAGVNTPTSPRGVLSDPPDINLSPTQTNPVPIVVTGENLPANTEVQVTVTPDIGERKTERCSLSGTASPLSCTVNMDIPDNAISVIQATATIDRTVAQLNPIFLEGERVKRMEISASFGGASEVIYVTESGRRIKRTE